MNRYGELCVIVPGKGKITVFRGKTVRAVLEFAKRKGLKKFLGQKINIEEVLTTMVKDLGWVYKGAQQCSK